jgi:cobalt/nickel transport protein
MTRQNILLMLGVVALAVVPLVAIRPVEGGKPIFGGSDDHAEAMITTIQPGYDRWFAPLWEPPSPEIASLLFGLQAAIGAGAVGYCLGYYRGRRRRNADDAARD